MKIAIVGGGPSAIFAILACEKSGIVPDLYIREMRIQPGAFWFHWIPDILIPLVKPSRIYISSLGSKEE